MAVFICINTIHFIIRRHDRFWFSFFDCNLKSGGIDFTECSFINYRIIRHTAKLLAVCRKVLWTCGDSFTLDSTHIGCCHLSCVIRILWKIFKVSSAQWTSLDIQSRSKDHIDSHGNCFFRKCLSDFFSKCLIPAVCNACCRRETGRRKAGV